ncbi:MAG: sialate O-acetylesterase, partial [Pseudomonadota bacterium]
VAQLAEGVSGVVGSITADPAIGAARFYDQQQLDAQTDYAGNTLLSRFSSDVGSIVSVTYRQDGVVVSGTDLATEGAVIDLRVEDSVGTVRIFPIESAVEFRAQATVVGNKINVAVNDLVPGSEVIPLIISGGSPYDGTYNKTAAELRGLDHLDGTIAVSVVADPSVGDIITLSDRGGWLVPDGRNLALSNEYLRNGATEVIPGETGNSYTIQSADLGSNVTPRVTGNDGVSVLAILGPATAVAGSTKFIVVVGQSQFDEHEPETPAVSYPGLKMWKGGAVVDAVSPFKNENTGVNMAMRTAQYLAEADPGNEYIVVGTVQGGTGLDNEWATGGVQYNNAVSEISAALANRPGATIEYILGAHGGAADGMSTDAFRAALITFRSDLCSDLGQAVPPMLNGTIYRSAAGIELLNDAMITVYEDGTEVYCADWRSGLTDIGDNTHLDQASMELAALRNVEALTASVQAVPLLTYSAGLQFAWPGTTNTDAGGVYNLYNPTAGKQPVSYELEYTINGGATQTQTSTYGDPIPDPGSPGDSMTGRIRVVYTDATQGEYSTELPWTVPSAASASYVGALSVPDNYDQPNPQSFVLTLPLGAQVDDDAIIYLVNRTIDANDSSIGNISINGSVLSPQPDSTRNTRTNGNAIAVVTHKLTTADISAGQITASFNSTDTSLRSEATGLVFRNGSNGLTIVPGMDLTEPSSDNSFAVTNGFPIAGLHFKSTSDPLTITGDATEVAVNQTIEGAFKNMFVVVGGNVAVSGTATVNMSGFVAGADPIGILAYYS